MPVVPSQAQDNTAAETPDHAPAGQAILSIVEFTGDRLAIHYREVDAMEVANSSSDSDLYDATGAPVALASDGSCLEKVGDEDPQAVRDRILAWLGGCAEDDSMYSEDEQSELRENIEWLRGAPDLRSLVAGLDAARVTYAQHYPCTPNCTAKQRAAGMRPPCCPKIV